MNDIKVTINNFGPIKDQEVTLAPLMIFTGNSNLGKSYVNYLMYYFFSAFTEGRLINLLKAKVKNNSGDTLSFTLTIDEIRLWLNNHVQDFMRDFLGDTNLECNVNFDFSLDGIEKLEIVSDKEYLPKEIIKHLSNDISKLLIDNSSLRIVKINNQLILSSSVTYEITWIISEAIKIFLCKHLFQSDLEKSVILPPARGAYVGETYSTKNNIAAATGMFRLFLRDFDMAVSSGFPMEDNGDKQFFESQIQKLVNGKLISEKGNQFLELANGHKIPITASASSIKELSPLLFYIMNWSEKKLSICLEEPEAHLHPDMQVNVANLLAAVKNRGSFLQLTTHSDYFLQRINQLIKLGVIRKKSPEQFKKICSEKNLNHRFYLDQEDIKAYYFQTDKDGFSKIIDLKIDNNGIPFSTFFNTVKRLSEDEEYLNEIMDDYGDCIE